jgi:hypothetical protein
MDSRRVGYGSRKDQHARGRELATGRLPGGRNRRFWNGQPEGFPGVAIAGSGMWAVAGVSPGNAGAGMGNRKASRGSQSPVLDCGQSQEFPRATPGLDWATGWGVQVMSVSTAVPKQNPYQNKYYYRP